jgi:hypothetical protein
MADDLYNEDAALRYVMGEGDDAERTAFESRLATSTELRALVNELESGVTALAEAAPKRRPPASVWRNIEMAVSDETRLGSNFLTSLLCWLRNGWEVAAVCLIGWVLTVFWVNQHYASTSTKPETQQMEIADVHAPKPTNKSVATQAHDSTATNRVSGLLQARTMEILELRGKIAALQTATTQMSRSLAAQHALLTESNRIKFYHLVPASMDGNPNTELLSPGLQIAVLTALARNLGWIDTTPLSNSQNNGNVQPRFITIGGVDFIDLRPGSQIVGKQQQEQLQVTSGQTTADNTPAAKQGEPQTQAQTQTTVGSSDTTTTEPTIPAFISGDNLVVALDSTVVPTGSLVTLTASGANQNQTGGTFTIGENPTVVTLPLNPTTYGSNGYLIGNLDAVTLSVQTPNGQTSTMQFSAPSTANP